MCLSFFHHIHSLFCKTAVCQYDSPMQTKAIFLLFILLGVAGCGTAVAPPSAPSAISALATQTATAKPGVAITVVMTVTSTPTTAATGTATST
ncbi:MAG: hypothetical protein WAS33_10055, partial [Candidatus Promineifilaceae bacterium]